jgi:hypothetical protein
LLLCTSTVSELLLCRAVFFARQSGILRGKAMKTLTTILAAAFIAGSATIALAQAGGTGGTGAGGDVNPDRPGKGADQNPSTPGANPAAGSKDADTKGQARTGTSTDNMQTAPVSGTTKSDSSSTPSQAPTRTSK